jgi:hypothetical protein
LAILLLLAFIMFLPWTAPEERDDFEIDDCKEQKIRSMMVKHLPSYTLAGNTTP